MLGKTAYILKLEEALAAYFNGKPQRLTTVATGSGAACVYLDAPYRAPARMPTTSANWRPNWSSSPPTSC